MKILLALISFSIISCGEARQKSGPSNNGVAINNGASNNGSNNTNAGTGTGPTNNGTPIPLSCGDGALDEQENCDGEQLNNSSCGALGFMGGVLSCLDNCTFDTSRCVAFETCNDGNLDTSEACEGFELRGETCKSQGFGGGRLRCTDACVFDTSACFKCGDGVLNEGEECDGPLDCSTFDPRFIGELSCSDTCTIIDKGVCMAISYGTCNETFNCHIQCNDENDVRACIERMCGLVEPGVASENLIALKRCGQNKNCRTYGCFRDRCVSEFNACVN